MQEPKAVKCIGLFTDALSSAIVMSPGRYILYRFPIGCKSDLRRTACLKSQRTQSVYLSLRRLSFTCHPYKKAGE